jgi:hypothetical protein
MVEFEAVKAWYSKHSGRDPKRGLARVVAIKEILDKKGLTLRDVRLVRTTDRDWASRGSRTEAESKAVRVGFSNFPGGHSEVLWLVPRKAVSLE